MRYENRSATDTEPRREIPIVLSELTEFLPRSPDLIIGGVHYQIFPAEAAALQVLISRKDNVVRYDELSEIMQTKSKSSKAKRMAIHIRIHRIRVFLETDPDLVGAIQNVWGKGFMFSPLIRR